MKRREHKKNYSLFTDDLNLRRKIHRHIGFLLQTMHTFSEDIRIEFGIQACEVITLKKTKSCEDRRNNSVRWESDDAGYKFLVIL